MEKPYLSIIYFFRNDDYQIDGFKRMETALNNLIIQAKKYNLRAELIIVEWNPPADRPLLKDVISLPADLGFFTVRFINVPSEIHKTYKCSEKIKIITTAALNVGIRRARGEFILTTNSDILFSNELIAFLASEKLLKDRFYRTFRYDVHKDVLKYSSLEEILDFCQKNIIQTFRENQESPHGLANYPVLQTACGVDFVLFSKEHWHLINGYPELDNLGLASGELVCYMAYLSGLKQEILDDPMRIYHIDHQSRWRSLHRDKSFDFVKGKISHLNYNNKLRKLLRKIYVFKTKAFKFFVDIFYSLFGSFLKKHSSADKWDFNISYIEFKQRQTLRQMLKGKRSYILNNNNWGFPKENFKEYETNK